VPGVLQLDWALELAAQLLGAPPLVVEIESLKLSSPLRPGQRFRIRSRLGENAKVEFKVWSRDSTHATGRVRLKMSSESSP
jgi:3-hydroxymyristoyl/3-hydroxydecanoyl-(acyl carrier protein) dehydratase